MASHEGKWSSTRLASMFIVACGVICIIASPIVSYLLTGDEKEREIGAVLSSVLLSVGCSLIATVFCTYISNKSQGKDTNDIYSLVKKIYEATPKIRIVEGAHLKNEFPKMLDNVSINYPLKVDVIGLELINFWNDRLDEIRTQDNRRILLYPNLTLRLLVQDPKSIHFHDMMANEQLPESTVRDNILKVTKNVWEIQSQLSKHQKVEIRWVNFPSSITITRVNEELYVRTRLIDEHLISDEDDFFEKYKKGEKPFSTYMRYFDNAWNLWEDTRFEATETAKDHYDEYIQSLIQEENNDSRKLC